MKTHRALSYELIRAFRQVKHLHWQGRKPIDGSTKSETIMLFVLYRAMKNGSMGLKASELSGALRIAMPSATQTVNVLEAKGLLERCPDPADRRVVRIRLTDEGLKATQAAEGAMIDSMSELIEHLGTDRTAQLIELLDDVSRFYEDRNPGNGCTPPLFEGGSGPRQSQE
jgi:DNA-binding MarR family transcriptional regulator